ncbi:hypothetical protein AB0C02_07155 [Micromonospora sp. NPDC048999]|uniref:hypothetical protein n=1 Tax=Micromonospora sp. NPDC048999 TaxID=3155391 RepID=UPI0033C90792
MGKNLRNWFGRLGAVGAAAVLLATVVGAPAQAATNPYTGASACSNDFGGSWSSTTDGHRSLTTPGGAKWGDVYLMYNSATGYNCVATIKTAFVGTATYIKAWLQVEGVPAKMDAKNYAYYAAVQLPARGKCVEYWGWVGNAQMDLAGGGRLEWGNCG